MLLAEWSLISCSLYSVKGRWREKDDSRANYECLKTTSARSWYFNSTVKKSQSFEIWRKSVSCSRNSKCKGPGRLDSLRLLRRKNGMPKGKGSGLKWKGESRSGDAVASVR